MQLARLCAVLALLGSFGSALAQDQVPVERRRSAAATVLRDAIAGGVLGSGVAGGIIFYEMGVDGREDYDWERTLAWGAAIGFGAGLLWGLIDAASEPDHAKPARASPPVRDGQSMSLDLRRRDQSRVQEFPLVVRRF
jgi:hypothetical protein